MNIRLGSILAAVLIGLGPALTVGIGPAHANAENQQGPVTIYVNGHGTTVYKTATTLAVDNGHSGNLQAYYLIVPPNGNPRNAEKHYSEHVFQGPLRPGVARDSYGPTGGFLDGTLLCAGWWDPSGRVTVAGFPCVRIHA
ncbi:hypothetical protein NONO_c62250 [Nocardia nova SH22a]|uniref:Uncharacterized protein n=1 Tax=Nocardia nova SH22a TaxID=1415166 RepID=W5TUZ9_9NOCA|nr:hypothetical protein [Nocardia nova]AHH20996.1 hypothetical protein NONO_c62250 [Nocardia nova SH22a]